MRWSRGSGDGSSWAATGSSTTARPAAALAASPGRLPYLPALDGLRALAMVVVLAFHAGVPIVRGGYLPLTAFFVLSGFLITALLLLERERDGRIDLRAFWGRRLRRLGPAAFLGLWLVVAYAAWGAGRAIEGLVGDLVSALTWSTNWRFIFSGQEYAAAFADPSPLQHYWSLAVEEQFYLVLPVLVACLLALGRGRRRWLVVVVAALTVASVLLTGWLHDPGDPPLRAYFGTDTRAAELLVGVLLACAMIGPSGLRALGSWGRRLVDVGGAAALAVSVWLWLVTPEYDDRLYEGGLLGIALLAAVVVIACTQPGTAVARLLAVRPVARFGRISYGVYLFHWPIFLWVDQDLTGLSTWPLFALRMAITVPLAVASFRLVETPLRARRWAPAPATSAWLNTSVVVVGVTAIVAAGLPTSNVTLRIEDREQVAAPSGAVGSVEPVSPPSARGAPESPGVPGVSPPEGGGRATPGASPDDSTGQPTTSPVASSGGVAPTAGPSAGEASPSLPATSTPGTPTPTAPATPGAPDAHPTQAATPPLRVMVVGDSIAFNLATGLLRYQEDGGPVVVQDSSVPGCTMTRGGVRRVQTGFWPVEAKCEWWASGEPAARIAAFQPDIVLVNSTVNEIFDRQRDEWGDVVFRSPGNALFDRFITDEWSAVTDVFAAGGVPVAWVTPVCTDFASYMPGYIEPREGDRRVDYFREELFSRLVGSRDVGVVDLQSELCPNDEYTSEVYGVEGARSDGFHVTDEVAEQIARRFLVPRLNELVGR